MNGLSDIIVTISKFGVPAAIALYLVYKLGATLDMLVISHGRITALLEELIRLH